jgi:hypothetical protein
MDCFVKKGDEPLTAAQLQRRTQTYIDRAWPEWRRERSIRKGDGAFDAYIAASVSPDFDMCQANNEFNHRLYAYRASTERLARYRLADGRPEVTEMQPTGEMDPETGEPVMAEVVMQTAIEPLPAEVEEPVYDEQTGEQTGTEMVPNPLIVADDEERAAAQAIVDATPQDVRDFDLT